MRCRVTIFTLATCREIVRSRDFSSRFCVRCSRGSPRAMLGGRGAPDCPHGAPPARRERAVSSFGKAGETHVSTAARRERAAQRVEVVGRPLGARARTARRECAACDAQSWGCVRPPRSASAPGRTNIAKSWMPCRVAACPALSGRPGTLP